MLQSRLTSGVSGLDEVLSGGLVPGQAYLVRGGPGSGKTTLGLHFLTAGVASGGSTLYITLKEPAEQIQANARALGFNLAGTTFLDLSPTAEFFTQLQSYDIFSPAEVEREPITQKIMEQVETLKPQRVFLDAITQFRYLTSDPFQFRKQVLSFVRFLLKKGATVMFTSESSETAPDDDLQFISDGVIHLDNESTDDRSLSVTKFRGSNFRSGSHFMRLTDQGMKVFPRILPEVNKREFVPQVISSGVPELDELLHGGLERSSITIITGSTGVGKTSLGLQFIKEAAGRGKRSVVYTFEEAEEILLHRCESINIPVQAMIDHDQLAVVQIEPLQFAPDEFANLVRQEVEARQAQLVMIDSVAGYRLSVRGDDLVSNLYGLCKYLQNMGVTVVLTNEIEYVTGDFRVTEVGISYVADNIIFLRYLEVQGQMRKAIGVLKKRLSDFERTLREIEITRYGIKVGKPLTELRGILSGTPESISSYKHE